MDAIEELEKDSFSVAHYDMRYLKPIDTDLLHEVLGKHNQIITVEDACIIGGLGSAVIEFVNDNNYRANVKRLGVPINGLNKVLSRNCTVSVDTTN